MPTSNVSIRLSLQDAETVRAGLEKLGADGAAALKKIEAAAAAAGHPGGGLGAIDKTAADLKSRLEETGRSLGPVGTLLLGLGPIGLTVAAALGGAVAVVWEMSKAANELGERASQIRNFGEETGLTTTAVQALTAEGSKFGLVGEQMAVGLQRLSVNLGEAHRSSGALYDDLRRLSPELAHQVAGTKDVASAYDLIGKAIKQATDAGNTTQANTIARAAFGRNPGGQGALAADVFSQGGVNSMAATFKNAGKALDEGLLNRVAKLKTEIDETDQRAKDAWASIFSEDVLERSLRMSQAWERMAKASGELSKASWGDWFAGMMIAINGDAEMKPADANAARAAAEQDARRAAAQDKLNAGVAAGKNANADLNSFWQPAGRQKPEAAVTAEAAAKVAKDTSGNLYTAYDDAKRLMAALGAAATPAEQLRLKTLELNVAVKDNSATSQVAARALQEFKNGQTAAAIAARERIGVASQEEIATVGLIQLQKDRRDGFIKSDQEMEQAEARVAKAAEQTYKQIQVQNAAFKGLKQFELDSQDVNANLDKLATGTLGNLNSALVDMEMNTRRNSDTWRNFGLTAVRSIEEILNKAALAKAISLLGIGGSGGSTGGLGALGAMFGFAAGGIMGPGGPLSLRRYAGGGVANSPQLAMYGEGDRPEAYVPLPDGRAIPVNLKGAGGGGHTFQTVTNLHVTVPPGSSQADANQMASSFARQAHGMMTRIVDQRIVAHLRVGGLFNPA